VHAQQAAVKMIAKPRNGAVWLRWAPNRPMLWKQANQYGYTLERYTIIRDGQVLPSPERQVLGQSPLKPLALQAWERTVDTSDYGAIVAQALYGESFHTDIKKEGQLMDIVNRTTELEQRFVYALFACDRSFPIAKMSGLGFVDEHVKQGEKYLYRAYVNIPVGKPAADTGTVFTGLADEQALPRPLDLGAMFADKAVMLSWNYSLLKDIYNSYVIERSSGAGQPFEQVTSEPLVNANEQDSTAPTRIYFVDSLRANYITYRYRVRGLDPFGEMGPPSDTVEGRGLPSLPYNPKITKYTIVKGDQVQFAWEFPAAGDSIITGFSIISAPVANGPFDTLQRDIPLTQRQWLLEVPLPPSSYMAVVAIGKNGTIAPSMPVLIQPEDTIPPAIPVALAGTVDSTGKVLLNWDANKEKDLQGYRVFRSNRPDGGFVQLTVSPQPDTLFEDSVQMHTLHHNIYYKITASDKRYNQSAFSAVLTLTKPDKVKPTPPVFSRYEISGGRVKLVWINTPDKEVLKYRLLRKERDQINAAWETVKEWENTGTAGDSLLDAPGHDKAFIYTLQSVAAAGLLSEYAPVLTIIIADDVTALPIPQLKTRAERESKQIVISWRFDQPGVKQYWLYRASTNSPMSLLQTLDGNKHQFVDKNLEINNEYQYTLKVIMENGHQSRFAELSKVTY
jgi:hypothetical protein